MICVKTVFKTCLFAVLAMVISTAGVAESGPYGGSVDFTEVTFTASDGKTVFADVIKNNQNENAPLIILYHQAGGSARGEYETIVPRLVEEGYNILAVDQRSGSDDFGIPNRTATQYEEEIGFCDAYPDLLAALDYAMGNFEGPRFVWGSSYSAGLVLNMGATRSEDLAGILSFSPAAAGPMEPCTSTPLVKDITAPVLALRPAREMTGEAQQAQLDYFKSLGFETYVAEWGVHGSSMLVKERTRMDVEETWGVVLEFLKRHSHAE